MAKSMNELAHKNLLVQNRGVLGASVPSLPPPPPALAPIYARSEYNKALCTGTLAMQAILDLNY